MDKPNDPDTAAVKAALERLGPQFDAVHIFATRYEQQETVTVSMGTGNWFARYGQIRSWLLREDEGTRMRARDGGAEP